MLLTQSIGSRTSCRTIQGVTLDQFEITRTITQSNYHYLCEVKLYFAGDQIQKMPLQPDISVIGLTYRTMANDCIVITFTLVKFLLPLAAFTEVLIDVSIDEKFTHIRDWSHQKIFYLLCERKSVSILAEKLDWSGLDWTAFVKHGFLKGGFVKHGLVKDGFLKYGFVKHGSVKGGFLKYGFVKHGSVKGVFLKYGFVKHGFVKGGFVKHRFVKGGLWASI